MFLFIYLNSTKNKWLHIQVYFFYVLSVFLIISCTYIIYIFNFYFFFIFINCPGGKYYIHIKVIKMEIKQILFWIFNVKIYNSRLEKSLL